MSAIPQIEGAGAAQRSASFDQAFQYSLHEFPHLAPRRPASLTRSATNGTLEAIKPSLPVAPAPSVGLSQPWRFVIVGDAARSAPPSGKISR